MHHLSSILFAGTVLAIPAVAQIVPGSLAVVRVGTGAAALTNASTATFVDLYTPAGLPAGPTISLPTASSGLNLPLTNSGTATSEGFLTQSVDARYLTLAGYGTPTGTALVGGSASATINRVVARIALDGTVDTTTALTDAYSAGNPRSAVSVDGSAFWLSGSNQGVRYATLGAVTSTGLFTLPANIRVANIFDNQLYCSSATTTFQGVSIIGTGLPTTPTTPTLLPGFPTATGPQNYDFFFADANTLYVADDRATGAGGIQKWALIAGTWTLQYTLAVTATSGCRGLSGYVDGGVTTLFATTTQANGNSLVSVIDAGAGSPFTTIATAAANTAFRGVRWVRTPASVTNGGIGCATSVGIPTIGTNGSPVVGNTGFQIVSGNQASLLLTIHVLNLGPSTAPVGFSVPGAPACVTLYVAPSLLLVEFVDPLGNAASALPLPPNALLGGAQLSAQAFPLDPAIVGFSLQIGASDALDITIGN
jgi:hypothetical protein